MALPRINETLNFTMNIPSTGQKVKYRPYLVKEEKVLLQAFESKDPKTCLEAMCDTITACLDPSEKIVVQELATFDIEYLFTQLRSKSVGEMSTIYIRCKECEQSNEYHINLEELEIPVEREKNIIKITDSISVEMRYPTFNSMVEGDVDGARNDVSAAIDLVAKSVTAVITAEERIDTSDLAQQEVVEFLNSMTATQIKNITDFLQESPALKHTAEFDCIKCATNNVLELKGLSDFF
jgi:nucleoid DNA-binding protein